MSMSVQRLLTKELTIICKGVSKRDNRRIRSVALPSDMMGCCKRSGGRQEKNDASTHCAQSGGKHVQGNERNGRGGLREGVTKDGGRGEGGSRLRSGGSKPSYEGKPRAKRARFGRMTWFQPIAISP